MTAIFTAARWLAIAIAVLAVIDPVIISPRRVKPEVALVTVDPRDSALARRTAARLDDDFTVVSGEYPGAAATVIVGDAMPERIPAGPVFAVREDRELLPARLTVPRVMTTEARNPVEVWWRGDSTREAEAELLADGVIVDRLRSDSANSRASGGTLYVTPTSPGALRLQLRVMSRGDTILADAVTEVVDDAHAVLFFDRRPSWMSTFVRRALERDRRFAVASRVITSRGVSTEAGNPPSTLADPSLLELYDVIVVGTPGLLTQADVAGLEAFLRRRGGAVVLLFDESPRPGPVDQLTRVTGWTTSTVRTPAVAAGRGDYRALRFTEAAWPARMPPMADTLARGRIGSPDRPLVWSLTTGPGQVLVNGALDAWKFRDAATSRFDEFWRATISRAARDAQDALAIEPSLGIAEPGEEILIRVRAKDTLARVTASLESASGSIPIPLWPTEGRITAPSAPGEYRLEARAGGLRAYAPLIVASGIHRLAPDQSKAIAVLARSTGGTVTAPDDLAGALRGKLAATERDERWHPMRSGWWIVPFVGLLALEWLFRRRRGLA